MHSASLKSRTVGKSSFEINRAYFALQRSVTAEADLILFNPSSVGCCVRERVYFLPAGLPPLFLIASLVICLAARRICSLDAAICAHC